MANIKAFSEWLNLSEQRKMVGFLLIMKKQLKRSSIYSSIKQFTTHETNHKNRSTKFQSQSTLLVHSLENTCLKIFYLITSKVLWRRKRWRSENLTYFPLTILQLDSKMILWDILVLITSKITLCSKSEKLLKKRKLRKLKIKVNKLTTLMMICLILVRLQSHRWKRNKWWTKCVNS